MGIENRAEETIVLGGGCFWCTEAVFKQIKGVVFVIPGYAGGTGDNPTYEKVSGGNSGYAEVVKITYDPAIISFRSLLTIFFASHDPTSLNRQGNNVGTQYRSVIFFTSNKQRDAAEEFISELNADSHASGQVVTELHPLDIFYEAEIEHQDYFGKNPDQAYCQLVINPKLDKIKTRYTELINS